MSLEPDTFYDCSSLTSIEIPASVTSIKSDMMTGRSPFDYRSEALVLLVSAGSYAEEYAKENGFAYETK